MEDGKPQIFTKGIRKANVQKGRTGGDGGSTAVRGENNFLFCLVHFFPGISIEL